MKILSIRRAPSGVSANILAHFDVELTPEIRLYNLALRQYPDGNRSVAAPNAFSRRTATFSTDLAVRLTTAAATAFKELNADANHAA